MKGLDDFLNPNRKGNLKFKLGGFTQPFEIKQLSSEEDLEVTKLFREEKKEGIEILVTYIAHSLVTPDLRSKDLLDALSKREGRPIFDPVEALKLIVNGGELAALIRIYNEYNEVTTDFNFKVKEIKNE